MTLYLYTTGDKYELPLVVADTAQGLADKLGKTRNGILSCISHGKGKANQRYHRVYVEDEDEEH